MIELKLKPKKWGNSIAVILPESAVREAKIQVGKPLNLLIAEKASVSGLWGKLKTKRSAKDLKKEAAEGWN